MASQAQRFIAYLRKHELCLVTAETGPEPVDGIRPGTICFAWGFEHKNRVIIFSETKHFRGERPELSFIAARHALRRFRQLHKQALPIFSRKKIPASVNFSPLDC